MEMQKIVSGLGVMLSCVEQKIVFMHVRLLCEQAFDNKIGRDDSCALSEIILSPASFSNS